MDDFSLLKVDYCELDEVGKTITRYRLARHTYMFKHKFRRGTVPFTGKFSGGSYYRSMRTFQERRMSLACDSKFIRGCRNIRNLPSSWEDYKISSLSINNWKKFGKKRKSWDK